MTSDSFLNKIKNISSNRSLDFYEGVIMKVLLVFITACLVFISCDNKDKENIKFKSVDFEYIENQNKNNKLEVLKGISLEVNQGEILTIIGPSGSGKSTLLRCINFLEVPEHGEVTLDNIKNNNLLNIQSINITNNKNAPAKNKHAIFPALIV